METYFKNKIIEHFKKLGFKKEKCEEMEKRIENILRLYKNPDAFNGASYSLTNFIKSKFREKQFSSFLRKIRPNAPAKDIGKKIINDTAKLWRKKTYIDLQYHERIKEISTPMGGQPKYRK